MSQPSSGLLQALVGYYGRLAADPNEPVADFGFSVEKISFCVVLEKDGTLSDFHSIRQENEKKKLIPNPLMVPDGGGRSGTGLKPFFCWDNTGYALGRDNKGNPARASEMFAAFRDLHFSFRDQLRDDPGYQALCRFLETWQPEKAESLDHWEEAAGLNVVFKLRAETGYIHDRPAVKAAWSAEVASSGDDDLIEAESLITGELGPIARLHPQLSGVIGANTTGAAIVSFNKDAFESYGKSQSYNAPVGVLDAFRYTTALNRLLASPHRRARIGDATVVFWSDQAEVDEDAETLSLLFTDPKPLADSAEDRATVSRVQGALERIAQGRPLEFQKPDAGFYILGLSPNASRLNVRYWLVGTVQQFGDRLTTHFERLSIVGVRPEDPPLTISRMLAETAREPKDISPLLAGSLTRAILADLPYPQALLNTIVRRVRTDSVMNPRRAAILKAHLIRNHQMEVPVALDKDHPDEAYQLGRLFAAIEYAQSCALRDINRSVKDGYFGSASATPASVFPRLLRLHQHHVEKLPVVLDESSRSKRTKRFFENLVPEICSHIRMFPRQLSLERQGLFQIAYYHQRQDFYTAKPKAEKGSNDE